MATLYTTNIVEKIVYRQISTTKKSMVRAFRHFKLYAHILVLCCFNIQFAFKHKHVGSPSKPAILICHTDEVTPLPVSVSLLPFQSYLLSNLRQGRQFQSNIIHWSKRTSNSHWDQHNHKTATDESSLCKQAYVIMIDGGLQVGWQIWLTQPQICFIHLSPTDS